MLIQKTMDLLGRKVKDKITGVEGVVVSVSFDLYGCVQCIIKPKAKDDGTQIDGWWTDTSRLVISDEARVMDPPDFASMGIEKKTPTTAERPGPEAKPLQ